MPLSEYACIANLEVLAHPSSPLEDVVHDVLPALPHLLGVGHHQVVHAHAVDLVSVKVGTLFHVKSK